MHRAAPRHPGTQTYMTKNEEIKQLALELLEDAEMSKTSAEGLVLKASRLARLVNDEEVLTWLWYERYNYSKTDDISKKYLSLTHRWIDVSAGTAYFAGIVTQEGIISGHQEELDVVKRFVPSGEWSTTQFQNQQRQVKEITTRTVTTKRIVSAVRALIQDFATRVYHEQLFSAQAASIFETYQSKVDALLSATAANAFGKMPSAFERLDAGDSEAISHALTTCRRVIDSFADAVFSAQTEPYLMGEEALDVGKDKTRNRLRAYIHGRTGKGSRYDRLSKGLNSIYDRVSAGVHSDVDAEEARALVLQTYLFLGELLSLPQPSA